MSVLGIVKRCLMLVISTDLVYNKKRLLRSLSSHE